MILISISFSIQYTLCTNYIDLSLNAIKFNYDNSGYENDALTIRSEDGSTLTLPEWELGEDSKKCAYIKSQTDRSVQIQFNSLNCADMHLLINLSLYSGNGIGEICNFFVSNYTRSEWITLPLNGVLPSNVGIWEFTWEWDVYAIPIDINYCSKSFSFNTEHTYFTLLAEP